MYWKSKNCNTNCNTKSTQFDVLIFFIVVWGKKPHALYFPQYQLTSRFPQCPQCAQHLLYQLTLDTYKHICTWALYMEISCNSSMSVTMFSCTCLGKISNLKTSIFTLKCIWFSFLYRFVLVHILHILFVKNICKNIIFSNFYHYYSLQFIIHASWITNFRRMKFFAHMTQLVDLK